MGKGGCVRNPKLVHNVGENLAENKSLGAQDETEKDGGMK
jgi:hypothetical protein